MVSMADDDENLKSKVSAPANTVSIGRSLGGGYFVDKDLVKRSEALKSQLISIRDKISSGKLTSSDAIKQLEVIDSERSDIAKAIEAQKVLVSAFNVYTKNESIEIPMSNEKLVIVTGDRIRIRPWKGPGIKCELERIIVAKAQPDDSEFSEIKVIHETGNAAEIVGSTRAERERDEAEFLNSEDGRKLNSNQLADRNTFLQKEIYEPQQKYASFQGKECVQISLGGLKKGNRQLWMEIDSEGGSGTHGSRWQRHAKLTIFVPKCNWILVRGCEAEVDISGIESNMILTTQGSLDRDFEGNFSVSKITGDVTIYQAPIRELVDIDGNIVIMATAEFVNRGTLHRDGMRTARPSETATTLIRDVTGNLKAHFLRTNLEVENILGTIDVRNEFGDTSFELENAFDETSVHRIVSESGSIELSGDTALLSKIPLYAHTLSGVLHSNIARDVLDEVSFSTGRPYRNWHGFVTPSKDRFAFDRHERPRMALDNQKRQPGFDLISRGGTVSILGKESQE